MFKSHSLFTDQKNYFQFNHISNRLLLCSFISNTPFFSLHFFSSGHLHLYHTIMIVNFLLAVWRQCFVVNQFDEFNDRLEINHKSRVQKRWFFSFPGIVSEIKTLCCFLQPQHTKNTNCVGCGDYWAVILVV